MLDFELEEGSSKAVEDYLKEIDYSPDPDYVPSEFALKFITFVKLIHNGEPENKSPVIHYKMLDNFNCEEDTINACHRGVAKLGSPSSKVMTVNGWSTMEEVKVGDLVINRYGLPKPISYKTPLQNPDMYRVTLSDGTSFEVGDEHLHIVWMYRKKEREKVLTTKQLLERPLVKQLNKSSARQPSKRYTYAIPLCEPVQFTSKVLDIPPYIMGYGIANGYFKKSQVSLHSKDYEEISNHFTKLGYSFTSCRHTSTNGIQANLKGHVFKEYENIKSRYKFIPKNYLLGSVEQRLELLRGLMDGDGSISKNGSSSYSTYSKSLGLDVVELVQSLGGIAELSTHVRSEDKTEYKVRINLKLNPFKLQRKASKWKPTTKTSRGIESIEAIPKTGGYCIYIDSEDHSYLTDGYTVTHNTTLLEYLIFYIAVFGGIPVLPKIPYALYVSDSMDNGVRKMRNSLQLTWDNSSFLQEYLPETHLIEDRWVFGKKDGSSLIVTGHGAATGVRGTRENNSRPVLALLDDLLKDSDAESPTIIAKIEATIYKAIDYALHPQRRKIIWNGTFFNQRDPLYKAIASGAWRVNVFPICEKFPCSREEFRGSWEDRFTYDYVLKQYNKALLSGKIDTFNQELMLRVMSDEDRLIADSEIRWYSRNELLHNINRYNIYITTDFATGEKTSNDFSVISVWAYANNGFIFWIDGICKKQLMDKNIDALFNFCQKYNPLGVGIEVSGQQGGFIPWIKNEMIRRNIFFHLSSENNEGKEGIRPSTNKLQRFMVALPWFKSGMVYFPEECKLQPPMIEMMDELSMVSKKGFKSAHDDFADTISMLPLMSMWKPSGDVIEMRHVGNNIWEEDIEDEVLGISSYVV